MLVKHKDLAENYIRLTKLRASEGLRRRWLRIMLREYKMMERELRGSGKFGCGERDGMSSHKIISFRNGRWFESLIQL